MICMEASVDSVLARGIRGFQRGVIVLHICLIAPMRPPCAGVTEESTPPRQGSEVGNDDLISCPSHVNFNTLIKLPLRRLPKDSCRSTLPTTDSPKLPPAILPCRIYAVLHLLTTIGGLSRSSKGEAGTVIQG